MLGALHVMWSGPNLIKSSSVSMLNKSRQVSLFAFRGRNAHGKSWKTRRNTERERERAVQSRSKGVQAVRERKKMQFFLCLKRTRKINLGVLSRRKFRGLKPHRGMKYSE